jgi:hypothetical protein
MEDEGMQWRFRMMNLIWMDMLGEFDFDVVRVGVVNGEWG